MLRPAGTRGGDTEVAPMFRRALCVGLSSLAILACGTLVVRGRVSDEPPPAEKTNSDATLHESFETERPSWRQETTNVAVNLTAHDRSERAAHDGRLAEHFRFTVNGVGNELFYSLPLPKIPLADDLAVKLFVRADRGGMQLSARVILPADVDPDSRKPSFVLVPGDSYEHVDRWQKLTVADLAARVEQQARILRLKTGRRIPLDGAYLDRLVVNLHGGPGETEVFLDDLTISPVPESAVLTAPGDAAALPPLPDTNPASPATTNTAGAGIRLKAGRIERDGRNWVPTILDAAGADLEAARSFGFDVLAVTLDEDPKLVKRAVALGFLLMPKLGPKVGEPMGSPSETLERVRAYEFRDAVAFWHLGEGLGSANDPKVRKAELDWVRAVSAGIRETEGLRSKLTTGTASDQLPLLSRGGQGIDMIGVDPMFWGSIREPLDTLEFLKQRRYLTARWNVRAPFWSWVDATVPDEVQSAVWGNDAPPAERVARVLPEQIRIATYLNFMAGYRAAAFRGDAELTKEGGKTALFEMALLNAEIDLIESILAAGNDPILSLPTHPADPKPVIVFDLTGNQGFGNRQSRKAQVFPETLPLPTIRAAAIATPDNRGRLVMVADAGAGAQFCPGQMSVNDLTVTIPGTAENVQAWEIRFGGVRWIDRDRPPGGIRLQLKEFDTTALVLLTNDMAMVERITAEVERIRPRAVDLAIKQARRQYEWVARTHDRLVKESYKVLQADELMGASSRSLQSAEEAFAREDYSLAWDEARRALRPLRMVMQSHYFIASAIGKNNEVAARNTVDAKPAAGKTAPPVVTPAISYPTEVSFGTYPQHAVWTDYVRYGKFSRNLLREGTFDRATPETLAEAGWSDVGYKDQIGKVIAAMRLDEPGQDGRGKALKFTVAAANPKAVDTLPAYFDHPLVAVRTPPIPVKAAQFYRIRVQVKMPRKMPAGTGGLIVRDSLGGERLEFRTTNAVPDWAEVTLFRRAPSDGELTVTLGLAGYGEALFDNLKIERLDAYNPSGPGDLAGPRGGSRPAAPRRPPAPAASEPEAPPAAARREEPARRE